MLVVNVYRFYDGSRFCLGWSPKNSKYIEFPFLIKYLILFYKLISKHWKFHIFEATSAMWCWLAQLLQSDWGGSSLFLPQWGKQRLNSHKLKLLSQIRASSGIIEERNSRFLLWPQLAQLMATLVQKNSAVLFHSQLVGRCRSFGLAARSAEEVTDYAWMNGARCVCLFRGKCRATCITGLNINPDSSVAGWVGWGVAIL